MKPNTIENSITICDALKSLQNVLDSVGTKYLLRNGNVEHQLKFLTASTLEKYDDFSYIMEKNIESHRIDFLAFSRGDPAFCAEFKCTFLFDPSETRKAIKDAFDKASKVKKIGMLSAIDNYVVHFLNHAKHEADGKIPNWIIEKYPNKKPIDSSEVSRLYKENNEKLKTKVYPFYREGSLVLEAVLVTWPKT